MKLFLSIGLFFIVSCIGKHTHQEPIFDQNELNSIELSFKRELVYNMQLDTNKLINVSIAQHAIIDYEGSVALASYKSIDNKSFYCLIGLFNKDYNALQINTLSDSVPVKFHGDSLVFKNDSLYFYFTAKTDTSINQLGLRYSIDK
ncbi:MAG: hypothetical protein ABJH05_01035 [Fulvivirga sp.]